MSSMSGSMASALAIETRCFMPVDRSLTYESAKRVRFIMSRKSVEIACLLPRSSPAIFIPNSTLSRTFSHGNSAPSWNTMIRSGDGSFIGLPYDSMLPLSGLMNPHIMRRSVDLPQPLGPVRHTNSPSPICRLMSLSASRSRAVLYVLDTWMLSIACMGHIGCGLLKTLS